MSDEAKRKRLIERVVKLFQLGEHKASGGQTGATEAEMLLAVTKARQLMAEHAISMAELAQTKGQSVMDAIKERIRTYTAYTRKGKALADYDSSVAVAVGILTDTRPLLTRREFAGTISMDFVGDEDDVAVAGELFMIWLKEVRAAARRVYGSGNVWDKRHTSYAVGYGDRLAWRAKEMVDLNSKDASTMALVVRSKQQAIAAYIGPVQEGKRRQRNRDTEAYWRGSEDGKKHNLQTERILHEQSSLRRCPDGVCLVDSGERDVTHRCVDCHGATVKVMRAAGRLPDVAPA